MKVGDVCMKIAGRDAGQVCVIVNVEKDGYLIDGGTRRRKCNAKHLEPLGKVIKVKVGESHASVVKVLISAGYKVAERKTKTKEKKVKVLKKRVQKSLEKKVKKVVTKVKKK